MTLQKRVHELKGRRLDAKAAVPKAHLGTAKLTKKMFVGGTGELTDQDFKDHFSQFGDIEDAAVSDVLSYYFSLSPLFRPHKAAGQRDGN